LDRRESLSPRSSLSDVRQYAPGLCLPSGVLVPFRPLEIPCAAPQPKHFPPCPSSRRLPAAASPPRFNSPFFHSASTRPSPFTLRRRMHESTLLFCVSSAGSGFLYPLFAHSLMPFSFASIFSPSGNRDSHSPFSFFPPPFLIDGVSSLLKPSLFGYAFFWSVCLSKVPAPFMTATSAPLSLFFGFFNRVAFPSLSRLALFVSDFFLWLAYVLHSCRPACDGRSSSPPLFSSRPTILVLQWSPAVYPPFPSDVFASICFSSTSAQLCDCSVSSITFHALASPRQSAAPVLSRCVHFFCRHSSVSPEAFLVTTYPTSADTPS